MRMALTRLSELGRLAVVAVIVSTLAGWPAIIGAFERATAPVVVDIAEVNPTRGPFLACFTWRFIKLRAARLVNVELDIHIDPPAAQGAGAAPADVLLQPGSAIVRDPAPLPPKGRHIDAAALAMSEDGLRYFMSDMTTPPTEVPQERIICADMVRSRIRPDESFRLVFSVTYQSWPGFWETRYRMHSIEFPAFKP